MQKEFSHITESGTPKIVDVGEKKITKRTATAKSYVQLPKNVLDALREKGFNSKKGPIFQIAILAGIMGAKKTPDLIPLCHPLSLDKVDVDIKINEDDLVEITCTAALSAKTGVEMEALTGASIAALTIYDMCKALSHDINIIETKLVSKTGGKSDYEAQ
jgi:cyclic pyranopterin phosphate synthase